MLSLTFKPPSSIKGICRSTSCSSSEAAEGHFAEEKRSSLIQNALRLQNFRDVLL